MGEKVKRVGIRKEKGKMYCVGKDGHIYGFGRREKAVKVADAGVVREKGWLYYVDKEGDVSRSKMQYGRRKRA